VVHGAVDDRSVLLDRTGKPWLLPLCRATDRPSGSSGADVRALASLALRALAGQGMSDPGVGPPPAGVDGAAWAQLAAAAVASDPTAAALGAALAALGPAVPVRAGRPAGQVRRPEPRGARRPPRGIRRRGRPGPARVGRRSHGLGGSAVRRVALLVAAAGLAGALLVGVRLLTGGASEPVGSGGAPRLDLTDPDVVCGDATAAVAARQAPTATPVAGAARPGPTPAVQPDEPADWAVTVRELYGRRAQALQSGDPAALCAVYAPGSPGLVADLELLARYAAAGVRPSELEFSVVRVGDASRSGVSVDLSVTDRLAAYDLVADDGTVRGRRPALPERTWRARLLVGADGQWAFG
jgi:hypothetical protein